MGFGWLELFQPVVFYFVSFLTDFSFFIMVFDLDVQSNVGRLF